MAMAKRSGDKRPPDRSTVSHDSLDAADLAALPVPWARGASSGSLEPAVGPSSCILGWILLRWLLPAAAIPLSDLLSVVDRVRIYVSNHEQRHFTGLWMFLNGLAYPGRVHAAADRPMGTHMTQNVSVSAGTVLCFTVEWLMPVNRCC